MPAEAYAKEESARGRVTTLLEFLPLKPVPATVYVPQGWEALFSFCYKDLKVERTIYSAQGVPQKSKTNMATQIFDFASVARVAISQI